MSYNRIYGKGTTPEQALLYSKINEIGHNTKTSFLKKTRVKYLEYKNKYPDIIKPIFHKKNLGINQNQNYMIDNVKVNGDVISFLAGDDLYKDNMLITFDNFINKKSTA